MESYCLTALKDGSLRQELAGLISAEGCEENLPHASLLASDGLLAVFGIP